MSKFIKEKEQLSEMFKSSDSESEEEEVRLEMKD